MNLKTILTGVVVHGAELIVVVLMKVLVEVIRVLVVLKTLATVLHHITEMKVVALVSQAVL